MLELPGIIPVLNITAGNTVKEIDAQGNYRDLEQFILISYMGYKVRIAKLVINLLRIPG